MKISVTSYSYYQYIAAGKMTQFDTLQKTKDLGIEFIELTDLDGKEDYSLQKENAYKMREEADRLGLPIVSYTIGAELNTEDSAAEVARLCAQVDLAKILGAPVMRHDVTRKNTRTNCFDLALPKMAEMTREVAAYAQGQGVCTCSENHGHVFQDRDRIERFFAAVNHENYGLLLDLGNMMCADEDPVAFASRLAPYAVHVHAKDMIRRATKPKSLKSFASRAGYALVPVSLGDGDVDLRRSLSILKNAGYDGCVSIEYEGGHDCIEGIRFGKEYLESVL